MLPQLVSRYRDENEVLFARVATDDLSAFVDDVTSSQPSADALTTLKNAFQYLTNDQDANGDPKWSATESEAATSWRPTFGRWASHGWMSIVWNGSMGTDGEYVAVIGACGGIVSLAEAWASLVEWTDLNCGTKVQYSTIEQIDYSSAAADIANTTTWTTPADLFAINDAPDVGSKDNNFGDYSFAQHPELQADGSNTITLSYSSSGGGIKVLKVTLGANPAVTQTDPLQQPPGVSTRDGGYSGMVGASDLWTFGDTIPKTGALGNPTCAAEPLRLSVLQLGRNMGLDETVGPDEQSRRAARWLRLSASATGTTGFRSSKRHRGCWFDQWSRSRARLLDEDGWVTWTELRHRGFDRRRGSTASTLEGLLFTPEDCAWQQPFASSDGTYEYFIGNTDGARSNCPDSTGHEDEVLFARVKTSDMNAFVASVTDSQQAPSVALASLRDNFTFLTAQDDANGNPVWSSDEAQAASPWTPTNGRFAANRRYLSIEWNNSLQQYLAVMGACGQSDPSSGCGDRVTYAKADAIGDPWTEQAGLFTLDDGGSVAGGVGDYGFSQHPELQGRDGRVLTITYSNFPSGNIESVTVVLDPTTTNVGLVSDLYQSVLGREPNAQEAAASDALGTATSPADYFDLAASVGASEDAIHREINGSICSRNT